MQYQALKRGKEKKKIYVLHHAPNPKSSRGLFKGPHLKDRCLQNWLIRNTGLEGAEEDQVAGTEFDQLSEKRDQKGKVQDDQVPAKATPHPTHTPKCANKWSATLSRLTCTYKPLNPQLSCIRFISSQATARKSLLLVCVQLTPLSLYHMSFIPAD